MRRAAPCVFAVITLASPAYAERPDEVTAATVLPSKENEEKARLAQMTSLIAKGDAEKRVGRFPDAANAYSQALRLGDNPLVGGRLGVLLVRLGNHVLGADYLLDAIDRADTAPAWERHAFLQAYDVAKAQVCRVTVEVSEAHAQILLDGTVKQEDGVTAFTMFVEPGDHELRAQLKGFDDAVVNFLANKGTSMRVTLELNPAAIPAEDVLQTAIRLPHVKQKTPDQIVRGIEDGSIKFGKPDPATWETLEDRPPPWEEKKEGEKQGPSFSVHGGVVVVFGAASWNPAVGGVLGVGLKPNEYMSFGLEGRAAWLTTGVADSAISAMTAGGLLSACGHLKWFFGCGLGHLGVTNVEFAKESYVEKTYSLFMPGGGARLGANIRFGRSFFAHASIDALGFTRGMKVVVDQTIINEQPPLMIGAQIGGGWEW